MIESERFDGERAGEGCRPEGRQSLSVPVDPDARSTLIVHLPDDVLEALARIASAEERSPEEVAEDWLAAAVRRVDEDPLLRLLGTVKSEVTDVAERHDEYIGRELHAGLHREDA